MDKNELLLNLRDIHLPLDVSVFPLAPFWYVAFFLLFLGTGIFYIVHRKGQIKREAIKLLDAYENQYSNVNNSIAAQKVSQILKRVALCYFPKEQVASLHGEQWIRFLDSSSKNKLNFAQIRALLIELPYKQNAEANTDVLFRKAKSWIKLRRRKYV